MRPDIVIASVPALLFILALMSVRRVPEGSAFAIHRFGRYARTLSPGLRLMIPLIERVAAQVELINHRIQLPLDADDGQRAALYYQIVEPARAGDKLAEIDAVVEREARAQLSSLLAAANDPDAFCPNLKNGLNARLESLGLRVTRCQLGT
ncbi:MAG: SPFH domain-containing protein [Lysobacteraceae bacterium]